MPSLHPDYIQPAIGGVPIGRPARVRRGPNDITPNSIDLADDPAGAVLVRRIYRDATDLEEAERLATWDRVLP